MNFFYASWNVHAYCVNKYMPVVSMHTCLIDYSDSSFYLFQIANLPIVKSMLVYARNQGSSSF